MHVSKIQQLPPSHQRGDGVREISSNSFISAGTVESHTVNQASLLLALQWCEFAHHIKITLGLVGFTTRDQGNGVNVSVENSI